MLIFALLFACMPDPSDPGSTDPSDSAAAPASEGAFSVLTYNVKGLPDALTGTDGASRMTQIAPGLEPFDVIGVQESFDAGFHDALIGDVDHPIRDWSGETLDSTRAYGNGLGLLIRGFEEVERTSFFYSDCNGVIDDSSDCLASKGLQRVRVAVPGTEAFLDIYNTHHEAGGGDDDVAARDVQVGEVIAAMEDWSADAAVLFMGDMNMDSGDVEDVPQLDRYEGFGLRDSCQEVGCPDETHIDRIWLRDGPELQLQATGWTVEEQFVDGTGEPLSDHPAIAAEVSWTR